MVKRETIDVIDVRIHINLYLSKPYHRKLSYLATCFIICIVKSRVSNVK